MLWFSCKRTVALVPPLRKHGLGHSRKLERNGKQRRIERVYRVMVILSLAKISRTERRCVERAEAKAKQYNV